MKYAFDPNPESASHPELNNPEVGRVGTAYPTVLDIV